jgi:protein Tex
MELANRIAAELSIPEKSVLSTVALLDEDGTVPFISRYRKEATGGLDEVQVAAIRDRLDLLRKLDARCAVVLAEIEKQGKLTDELKARIKAASTSTELEDLYLPYKPKRKTRATVAIAKGLEPLADLIWAQEPLDGDPDEIAGKFISEEKGVPDIGAAWAGAGDIVAERVSEAAEVRAPLRNFFLQAGTVTAGVKKGKEAAGAKYRDYFDYTEPTAKVPSHRMLAIRRGESEGVLGFRISADRDEGLAIVHTIIVKDEAAPLAGRLIAACVDAYDRLLTASIEGQVRNELKKRSDAEAITVFAKNLRRLLMAPPLGPRWVLGVDPGIRTGCKMVALDDKGDLLAQTVVHVLRGSGDQEKAAEMIEQYCKRYRVQAVAVGNGTGGRRTESFFQEMDRDRINDAMVVRVNEDGASVYSASETAREEFPDQDVTVRGAISIGRRLQDPLSELVKIDAKSIGVGQYQHDVEQKALVSRLDDVVESCVNSVGVELNTASAKLLSYVSGLNPKRGKAIVEFRKQNGHFTGRQDLMQVPGFGPKTFEQAAGFLRIRTSENPLDGSAVHPERYELVQQMAADLEADVKSLMTDKETRAKIEIGKYVTEEVGEPTLRDILAELEKPGRDPRDKFDPVKFDPNVRKIQDLHEGMIMEGSVSNVTNFGAFVDLGVHQDGLVHVSELSHSFVEDPSKVVEVGKKVKVKVLEVDMARKRISLSIKQTTEAPPRPERPQQRPQQRPPQRPRQDDRRPPRRNDQRGGQRGGGGGRNQQQPRGQNPPAYTPFANLMMENGKIKIKDEK